MVPGFDPPDPQKSPLNIKFIPPALLFKVAVACTSQLAQSGFPSFPGNSGRSKRRIPFVIDPEIAIAWPPSKEILTDV